LTENGGSGQNSPLVVPYVFGRQIIDCFVFDFDTPQSAAGWGAGRTYCMAGRVYGTAFAEDASGEAGDRVVTEPRGVSGTIFETAD